MKAAFLYGPSDLRIEEVEDPVPAQGEVVIRVEVGLTDSAAARTVRQGYVPHPKDAPVRLGRVCVGRIDAVGEGVETFEPGDRVVPAGSTACGVCTACARGLAAQCTSMVHLEGTFADAVRVPALVVATNLHRVPDGLEPAAAALAEGLARVLKGRDRMPARAGERAVVLGAGAAGLLWTRVLALTDVHVTTVDPLADRRALAATMGAHQVAAPDEFEAEVRSGRRTADLVVEASGEAAAWETALRAPAPGGRVLFFSGAARGSNVPLDAWHTYRDELMLVASRHHTPYHFAEAVRALTAAIVDADVLVGERVALAALPAFYERYEEGGGPPLAAVVP